MEFEKGQNAKLREEVGTTWEACLADMRVAIASEKKMMEAEHQAECEQLRAELRALMDAQNAARAVFGSASMDLAAIDDDGFVAPASTANIRADSPPFEGVDVSDGDDAAAAVGRITESALASAKAAEMAEEALKQAEVKLNASLVGFDEEADKLREVAAASPEVWNKTYRPNDWETFDGSRPAQSKSAGRRDVFGPWTSKKLEGLDGALGETKRLMRETPPRAPSGGRE